MEPEVGQVNSSRLDACAVSGSPCVSGCLVAERVEGEFRELLKGIAGLVCRRPVVLSDLPRSEEVFEGGGVVEVLGILFGSAIIVQQLLGPLLAGGREIVAVGCGSFHSEQAGIVELHNLGGLVPGHSGGDGIAKMVHSISCKDSLDDEIVVGSFAEGAFWFE